MECGWLKCRVMCCDGVTVERKMEEGSRWNREGLDGRKKPSAEGI